MPNTIQPQEYSRGGGMEDTLYITDSDGNLNVFNVKRNDDGKQYLNANNGNADNVWNSDVRFLFLRRKSLISLPFLWESFVLKVVHSNHRAFFQPHPFSPTKPYTFYYLKILFPKVLKALFLKYQSFLLLI